MERRVLRRAADEALLTPAFVRSIDMPTATPSITPPADTTHDADDADRRGADPDTEGHQPLDAITEPIAVTALHDRLRNAPDDLDDDVPPTAPAADRPAIAPIDTWKPELIERRRVRSGPPWYRTKAAATALAAVAVAAIVVSAVLVVSRGSEQAATVAPQASTTAAPRPSSGRPAPSSVPPAASNAHPAPPLPPSAAPASPAPVVRNHDSWTPSAPSPTKKLEIDVTRAPFSATPPPPPAPGVNSATPGDGRRPHWGPW
jgi:hypothetical protein